MSNSTSLKVDTFFCKSFARLMGLACTNQCGIRTRASVFVCVCVRTSASVCACVPVCVCVCTFLVPCTYTQEVVTSAFCLSDELLYLLLTNQ